MSEIKNVADYMDEALDVLYGEGDNGTRFVRWMNDNGLTWGESLSAFYQSASPPFTSIGDEMSEYWATQAAGGGSLPANGILESGHYILHDGHYVIWS